ncbi:CHAT domain-containing tetratricopeptide repeat protein [Aquimarina sp. 2201CG5-10]|uniref:CHAT domain-containing protein n=1 Tax=Aquimarina callyspongiae TaxID=3098150 RepID=UPI002AB5614E|nr:CHAT domain-containing tetratricopeptide repeat protein [Aquimarina sp. 2201CG5-10]MDY8136935.1 CHAT domain-containing tetratricopeptide repeat protein [Aquimarina sp. 2201CG5-10]
MHTNNFSTKRLIVILNIVFLFSNILHSQTVVDTVKASVFYKKGDSLFGQRNFTSAIANFEEARKIYKQTPNWERIASCHNKLSENYQNTFGLEKALHHAQKALQISETKIPDNARVKARALDNLGTYYRIGKSDFDLSLEYYEKAFQLRSENLTKEDQDFARSHYNFGTAKTYKGLYEEAMDHFNKAIEVRKKKAKENPIEIAEIYRQIGNVFYEQGLYDDTLAYLEKALIIANNTYKPDNFYFVDLYNNIGLMYSYKKEENRSLEYYIKSLQLSELHLGVDHPDQVRMHYNIANIYYFQKNKEKALFHVNKTIEIGVQTFGENFPNLALPYSLKGLLLRGEEGIVYIKKALVLARKVYGENNVRTAYFYSYLSELYHEVDQYKTASEYAEKALDIRLKVFGKHNFYVVESYNLMAIFEIDKKKYDKALIYLEKAITANTQPKSTASENYGEFDRFLSLTRLLKSLERKAFVLKMMYEKGNDAKVLNKSVITYEKASRLVETIRKIQYNKEDKITFAKDAKNVFYGGIATQLLSDAENGEERLEKAFNYAERSKANLLKEMLNDANAKGFSGLPKKLLLLEKRLREDLSEAKSIFYNNIDRGITDTTKVSNIEGKIADVSRRQDSLKDVLEKRYPKYYQLKYEDKTLSVKEIQKKIDQNTTLLEYFVADSTLYVFLLTKDTAKIKELSISGIDKKIRDFRKSITFKNTTDYVVLGHELYNDLIAPIKNDFKGDHLIIIPDESLWHLNFDLLLTSDKQIDAVADLPYLLNRYSISYTNSATILYDRSNEEVQVGDELLKQCLAFSFSGQDSLKMGDVLSLEKLRDADEDLPGTRKEIKAIADIVEGRYFFGSEAVESNFKKNTSRYNILHLALHGEVDDKNPENSKIYFTKTMDSLEDNVLHGYELYALDIPAELTVLSACNTGVGKIAKGEGVLSLGTAFQYAGTKSLLLSSWEVSDEITPLIMKNFYTNLGKGMSKAKALQQAKLAYIKNADVFTNHPVYWGGFYLIGNNNPIEFETPSETNWILYIILVVLGVVILVYGKRKLIK